MRPDQNTARVSLPRSLTLLAAMSLLLSVVPSAPAVADPPDVVYSDGFAGDGEVPWATGWTHLSSDSAEDDPYLEDDKGVLDSSGHGVVSLRPGVLSDSVQKLRAEFYDPDEDGQMWGLAIRSDGSGYWSDSGYYCVLDYHDNDEDALLSVVRVSNGVRVVLSEPTELSLTADVWLKCEADGSNLKTKVWTVGGTEPTDWDIEVSDATYATGRSGTLLEAGRNVEVIVDDYSLEGYESEPVSSPDPGGGDWYTDTFTGDDGDPWDAGWTHQASGTPLPFLGGGSGILDADDDELQVTSLRSSSYTDSEQLVRVIWYPEESRHWGLVVRHDGGNDGTQSGYYCLLTYDEDVNDGEPTLAIVEYNQGADAVLDEVEVDVATNQWLKCVAEGDQIKAKVWDQTVAEPSAWDLEVTDNTHTSGQVGVYLWGEEDDVRVDDYRLGPDPDGPGDVTAPQVEVLSPVDGSAVGETTTVEVQATDDVGVTQVEVLIDGAVVASLTSPDGDGIYRFEVTFDASGGYQLASRATDAADNVGNSEVVSVTVPAEALPSTYFVFSAPQTMTDVFAMLDSESLQPVEFEHVIVYPSGDTTGGGFYAPDVPMGDQEAYYRALQHDKYGVDPAIISVRIGGSHTASSLGDLSDEVSETEQVPALSGDGETGADGPPAQSAASPAAMSSVSPSAEGRTGGPTLAPSTRSTARSLSRFHLPASSYARQFPSLSQPGASSKTLNGTTKRLSTCGHLASPMNTTSSCTMRTSTPTTRDHSADSLATTSGHPE